MVLKCDPDLKDHHAVNKTEHRLADSVESAIEQARSSNIGRTISVWKYSNEDGKTRSEKVNAKCASVTFTMVQYVCAITEDAK